MKKKLFRKLSPWTITFIICGLLVIVALCIAFIPSSSSPGPGPTGGHLSASVAAANVAKYLKQLESIIGSPSGCTEGCLPNPGYTNKLIDSSYGKIDSTKETIVDDVISNFADSVYLWNTFVYENNKKQCSNILMNKWDSKGKHVQVDCKQSSWVGWNYLAKLYPLFDNVDLELNKINLALLLGNAWNESGNDNGLFGICTQAGGGYQHGVCNPTAKEFVGRGLLQLSNDNGYLMGAHILTDMYNTLKDVLPKGRYLDILNRLKNSEDGGAFDQIYPKVCGKGINSFCPNQNPSSTGLESGKNCCVAPLQVGAIDCKATSSNNNIYNKPTMVCDYLYSPLPILTSLIYYSANAEYMVTNLNYQFKTSACAINQGGMPYPICTSDYEATPRTVTKNQAYPSKVCGGQDDDQKKADHASSSGCIYKCNSIEGSNKRYEGFCTVMDLLFPGRKIRYKMNDNNKGGTGTKWSVTLKNGQTYQGCPNAGAADGSKPNAGFVTSCKDFPDISVPKTCTQ